MVSVSAMAETARTEVPDAAARGPQGARLAAGAPHLNESPRARFSRELARAHVVATHRPASIDTGRHLVL